MRTRKISVLGNFSRSERDNRMVQGCVTEKIGCETFNFKVQNNKKKQALNRMKLSMTMTREVAR